MRMLDLIAKKRDGSAHTAEEIAFIVNGASKGDLPDYQLAAWLMAVVLRGMTRGETVALTDAMGRSGRSLDLSRLRAAKVDKHSTGGVGDGVSLALAPLVASTGVAVPMMSGRGLGHTGGTLDKLESIRRLRVNLSVSAVERQVRSIGVCMFGQSQDLAPADRKLYALRDVTGTVASQPLIVGSILSKKLSESLDALLLDVKCGSGAIFQEESEARALAQELIRTAKSLGLKCVAVLTAMDQPLGRAIGNALELRQAIDVLHGDASSSDYVEVLLTLGGWMLHLAGRARNWEEGAERLQELIRDGKAAAKFRAMVKAQGGDPRVADQPDRFLPQASRSLPFRVERGGFVGRIDALATGRAAVALGAGRDRIEDKLDYGAGIVFRKKAGDPVQPGEEIARLYADDAERLRLGHDILSKGVQTVPRRPRRTPVVRRVWR
ncbi:MAG: thymidine phosphorylase [Elusimicrobiota bacterium]